MPMPRRLNYVIQDTTGSHAFIIMRNDLVNNKSKAPAQDLDSFESLSSALEAMELSQTGKTQHSHVLTAVETHPRFREAMEEYYSLMTAMHLPSCSPVGVEPCNPARAGQGAAAAERHQPLVPQYTHGAPLVEVDEAAEEDEVDEAAEEEMRLHVPRLDVPHHLSASELSLLDDAVHTLILVLRRRRERADHFYATMQEFVNEYTALQQDLSSAEPLLKGSHLSNKIQQMKETVKRKYGTKVQELQKECVNKRRRANLPKSAVEVMEKWFRENSDKPYPSEEQKRLLAVDANIKEDQVSNWFVNVRKRYWRPGM